MATAAAVTTDLRVGSLVLGNDYKHPVVLARELTTIDLLSDGRLEAGGFSYHVFPEEYLDLVAPVAPVAPVVAELAAT